MLRKSFYEFSDMLRSYLKKKRTRLSKSTSVEAQVGSFLYYISNEARYRKTPNAFGISGASILGIIRRVSYAVTIILVSKLARLHTTEGEVQELTDRSLEAHGLHSV